MTDSQGRQVCDVETDSNGDGSRYFVAASYLDDGSSVPESELEYLDEAYPEYLAKRALDDAIRRAEDWADRDR
jgi:hypothetical protein